MLPKQESSLNSKSALAITIHKNDHSPNSGFHYVGVAKKSKQNEDGDSGHQEDWMLKCMNEKKNIQVG